MWNEEDHPREDDGTFRLKDGSAKSGSIVPGRGEAYIEKSRYKEFTDKKSVDDFFLYDDEKRGLLAKKNSSHGQWDRSLTPHQRYILSEYTANGYININSFLRGYDNRNNYNTDYIKKSISAIDNAISTYMLKEPIVTYRAIDSYVFAEYLDDFQSLVGAEYTDKAFMSTSPSLDSPALKKDLMMKIYLPAGKGIGAYIDEYNRMNEIEFIIARGSRFVINKAFKDKNTYWLEMELIK